MTVILLLLGIAGAVWPKHALAEPWLGSKYAQNCAGCHAPGRKNLPAIDRRCTLSCQGCHVNPNGGGLRSFYGKWTQERWLRSYISPEWLDNPKATATVFKQHYRPAEKAEDQKKEAAQKKKRRTKKPSDKPASSAPSEAELAAEQQDDAAPPPEDPEYLKKLAADLGYPLITTDEVYPDPAPYDRRDPFYKVTAKDINEFILQIPQDDPYRQFDQSRVDGGFDARLLQISLQNHSQPEVKKAAKPVKSFLMSIDFNLRYRPFRRYFHLVYENRILGTTADNTKYSQVLGSADTRSLYAMVDNLPFNIFVQGGLYRPLFGNYIPDHNHLSQRMFAWATTGSRRAQAVTFQAASIGTAPNVPFANLHYIGGAKAIGNGAPLDSTTGFAANGGLRFVTLGGVVNYSYWNTQKKNDDNHLTKLQMHGFGIMGTIADRLTQGFDFITFERDDLPIDVRSGAVTSSESYIRTYRENYLTVNYSYANRTVDLLPGTGQQLKVGVRSFVIPGLDIGVTVDRDIQKATQPDLGTSLSSTSIVGQTHLYF